MILPFIYFRVSKTSNLKEGVIKLILTLIGKYWKQFHFIYIITFLESFDYLTQII